MKIIYGKYVGGYLDNLFVGLKTMLLLMKKIFGRVTNIEGIKVTYVTIQFEGHNGKINVETHMLKHGCTINMQHRKGCGWEGWPLIGITSCLCGYRYGDIPLPRWAKILEEEAIEKANRIEFKIKKVVT